jgi:hypothetical protein
MASEIFRMNLEPEIIQLMKAYAALQGEAVSTVTRRIFLEAIAKEPRLCIPAHLLETAQ